MTLPAGSIVAKAYLALPEAPGPHPGILISPEWWGHNDFVRMRADMLATLGYAALAMDLYGNGKKAHDPQTAARLDGALKGNQKEMNCPGPCPPQVPGRTARGGWGRHRRHRLW